MPSSENLKLICHISRTLQEYFLSCYRVLKSVLFRLPQNEAHKLNHQEVVEEDKRLKLPANWEAKKARLEWELNEDEKKKVCNTLKVLKSRQWSINMGI